MTDPIEDYAFASSYRSGADDLAGELFVRALERATVYQRAAGFFSSSSLQSLAAGLRPLLARGGSMVLVTSPELSGFDLRAITRFYVNRESALAGVSSEGLFAAMLASAQSPANIFGELLRRGAISMYVARPRGGFAPAIYHEKFAVFSDGPNALAVSGSGNESALAYRGSFERFEVFRSWVETERTAVHRFRNQFAALIDNTTVGLEVVPLVRAYLEGWLSVRAVQTTEQELPVAVMSVRSEDPEILVPFPGKLFEHQEVAIKTWAAAGGRGLLSMATGSGKTITALSIAARLKDALSGASLVVVIVAPFIHLVDQWIGVGDVFGLRPIRCAEGENSWRDTLATAIFAVNAGTRPVLSVAVTSATLQTLGFQRLLARIRAPLLVIGDEAHNYGTPKMAAAMPAHAAYRVGLSATPVRWMDDDATARIEAYFGPVVHTYGLDRALKDEVLTPYEYHPLLIEFDPDEARAYEEISAKLARFGLTDESDDLTESAKALLMRRARLVASASGKIPQLRTLLSARARDSHVLIYCGDGQVGSDQDEMPGRQIDAVVQLVLSLGMTCAKYTAETSADVRRQVLEDFDAQRIQVLVAIRCLDEGVDVPSTRIAYILSSSTNPRQFIQRRGRVLRRSPETGKRKAEIFDFFVIPPTPEGGDAVSRSMRGVVRRQLQRVAEFSNLALNGAAARASLIEWTRKRGLLGLWGSE